MPESQFDAKLSGVHHAFEELYNTFGVEVSWAKHPPSKRTDAFIAKVLSSVEDPGKQPPLVYDLGCGDGGKSFYLAKHGLRVVGFDYIPVVIERARHMALELGLQDRVSFEHADILDLPHNLEPAVGVHEYQAFSHIPKEGQSRFAEIVSGLLVSGGIFLTNAFNRNTVDFYGENISLLPNGEYTFHYDSSNPKHAGREMMEGFVCYFFTRGEMRRIWSKRFIIEQLEQEPHPSLEGRIHWEGLMVRK